MLWEDSEQATKGAKHSSNERRFGKSVSRIAVAQLNISTERARRFARPH
jgi:hypothetical protein